MTKAFPSATQIATLIIQTFDGSLVARGGSCKVCTVPEVAIQPAAYS
jgi:hypothetical protein